MATVTVRGQAEVDVPPDRVRLLFSVRAEAVTGAEALALVAERSAATDAVLDRTADLVLLRRPAAVTLGQQWAQDGRSVTGHQARRTVLIEARATGPLGELLAALVEVPGSAVDSTEWVVDRDNPVHARVRGLAVLDAGSRAADYATAAELRLGAVETITEPGAGSPSAGYMEGVQGVARAFKGGGGGEPVLELLPQPVPVGTSVEVRYALLS